MRKNKQLKRTLYILTEGYTEKSYYSRIGEIVGEDSERAYSIKVDVREIMEGTKTNPLQMVEEAVVALGEYDEVWVVFDKDRERDELNRQAFALTQMKNVNIAFSSISFEYYLILHFEKNDFAFERSDCASRSTIGNPVICTCHGEICATGYLRLPSLLSSYKKGSALLYDSLKNRNIIAMENCAWIKAKTNTEVSHYLCNPYSDNDILLSTLINLDRVEYHEMNEIFSFNQGSIRITDFQRDGTNVIVKIDFGCNGKISFAINNQLQIMLVDGARRSFSFKSLAQASIVEPENYKTIDFEFTVDADSVQLSLKSQETGKYHLVDLQ